MHLLTTRLGALLALLCLLACSDAATTPSPSEGQAPDAPWASLPTTSDVVTETQDVGTPSPDSGGAEDSAARAPKEVSEADVSAPEDRLPSADLSPSPDAGSATDLRPNPTPDAGSDQGTTAPLEVRFVAIGDTGEGNDSQHAVADAIEAKCAADGCDFAVMLGDNVYDAGVDSIVDDQWFSKFEEPYENLDFPFYAVLGNHDNGGLLSEIFGTTFDGSGAEFDKGDIQVAYTQHSDKWTMPARVYDFVAGPAHFFALDTNDMMWAPAIDEAKDRSDAQRADLPPLMDNSESPWIIVLGHHPYISNGAHGNAGTYEGLDEDVLSLAEAIPFLGSVLDAVGDVAIGKEVKEALEDILCNRVDLYMSGHDHTRQWFEPLASCPGVHFIVSGAGSKTKSLQGSNPAAYADGETPGFLWVEIIGNQLRAEFIDVDGTVSFATELTK